MRSKTRSTTKMGNSPHEPKQTLYDPLKRFLEHILTVLMMSFDVPMLIMAITPFSGCITEAFGMVLKIHPFVCQVACLPA